MRVVCVCFVALCTALAYGSVGNAAVCLSVCSCVCFQDVVGVDAEWLAKELPGLITLDRKGRVPVARAGEARKHEHLLEKARHLTAQEKWAEKLQVGSSCRDDGSSTSAAVAAVEAAASKQSRGVLMADDNALTCAAAFADNGYRILQCDTSPRYWSCHRRMCSRRRAIDQHFVIICIESGHAAEARTQACT